MTEANIRDFLREPGDRTFKVFKIVYSPEEEKTVKEFDLKKYGTYEHFGSLKPDGLTEFLAGLGANSDAVVDVVQRFVMGLVETVCRGYGREAMWLAIRVTGATDQFDVSRWHVDGNFFKRVEGVGGAELQSKFIFTPRGPGTLLCETDPKTRAEFLAIDDPMPPNDENKKIWKENNVKRDQLLRPVSRIQQAQNDEGIIFFVGDPMRSAIHSEPPIHERRIFISILPGSPQQIRELREKWKR